MIRMLGAIADASRSSSSAGRDSGSAVGRSPNPRRTVTEAATDIFEEWNDALSAGIIPAFSDLQMW